MPLLLPLTYKLPQLNYVNNTNITRFAQYKYNSLQNGEQRYAAKVCPSLPQDKLARDDDSNSVAGYKNVLKLLGAFGFDSIDL